MESIYDELILESDEIRLLELRPAEQFSDQIRCRLLKAVLSKPPSYEALSYAWGDPKDTIPIVVNGRSFDVTANLLAGLKHNRRRNSSVLLWIDAICINQQDIPERNHQIQLMRDIYMQAEQALVWLGESSEDSDLAMDLIRRWSPPLPPTVSRNYSSNHEVAEVIKCMRNPFEVKAWEALRSLFQRPYWERSWILQEIIFSKQVTFTCGSEKINWLDLEDALFAWVTLSDPEIFPLLDYQALGLVIQSHYHIIQKICHRRLERQIKKPEPSALKLIQETFLSKATDPRDKIYAFLGFDDFRRLGLEPDYEKPAERVYGEFVQAFVAKERKLDLLSHAGIRWPGFGSVLNLPSWVPDFRGSDDGSQYLHSFRAAGDEQPKIVISEDLRVLTARGVIFDEIKDIDHHDENLNIVKTFWQDLALRQPGLHPTGMPYLQAYFRTIVADNSGYGYGQQPFRDAGSEKKFFDEASGMMWWLGKWALDRKKVSPGLRARIKAEEVATKIEMNDYVQHFMLWSGSIPKVMTKQELLAPFLGGPGSISHIIFPDDDNLERGRQCSAVFLEHMSLSCINRSFLISEKGYLGLAPKAAKIGDLICVLLGCDKPLIIRKESNHYILVGDSYIYGVMNGEVVEKDSEKAQDIIFH